MEEEPSQQQVIEESIALMKTMPSNVNPLEYISELENKMLLKASEDAYTREIMKSQLTFLTYSFFLHHSMTQQHNFYPRINKADRVISRKASSAPASPLKPGENEVEAGTPLPKKPKREEVISIPMQISRSSVEASVVGGIKTTTIKENENANAPLASNMNEIDSVYIHLAAALEYAKENKLEYLGLQRQATEDQIEKAFYITRTLCKKVGEMMSMVTADLEAKYWEILCRSGVMAANLYEAYREISMAKFSLEPEITYLVDTSLCWLKGNSCNDVIEGSLRFTCVYDMIIGIRSVPLRHKFIAQAVLICKNLVKGILKTVTDVSRECRAISIGNLTAGHRYLHLIEYITCNTCPNRWIDEDVWINLKSLEKIVQSNLSMAHVAVMVLRIVRVAKSYTKFEDESFDYESLVDV